MNYYQNKSLFLEGEIWKDVPPPEFYGYYQVSNFGRVKSLKRKWNENAGHDDMIMSQGCKYRDGKIIQLSVVFSGARHTKSFAVSKLVTMCFFPEFYGKKEYIIIHKDGDNSNNSVENILHVLEYDYRSHKSPARKLTLEQIIKIRELVLKERKPKGFYVQYARDLGISYHHLRQVMKNKVFQNLEIYDTEATLKEFYVKRMEYNSNENIKKRQREYNKKRWKTGKIQASLEKRFQNISTICACCGKICHPKSYKQLYNLKHKGYIYCSKLCKNKAISKAMFARWDKINGD